MARAPESRARSMSAWCLATWRTSQRTRRVPVPVPVPVVGVRTRVGTVPGGGTPWTRAPARCATSTGRFQWWNRYSPTSVRTQSVRDHVCWDFSPTPVSPTLRRLHVMRALHWGGSFGSHGEDWGREDPNPTVRERIGVQYSARERVLRRGSGVRDPRPKLRHVSLDESRTGPLRNSLTHSWDPDLGTWVVGSEAPTGDSRPLTSLFRPQRVGGDESTLEWTQGTGDGMCVWVLEWDLIYLRHWTRGSEILYPPRTTRTLHPSLPDSVSGR